MNANLTLQTAPSLCHSGQADALLKLKRSFIFDLDSTTTLQSWQAGSDCCLWEGVGCSNASGHVTVLDLSGVGLHSKGIDTVIFNLTSLRVLDLSMNDFGGLNFVNPSDGFERLSSLTHLNLSNAGITGQIPKGIRKLTNLVTLYLSCSFTITDDEHHFQNLVANLSNLRELKLDGVLISARAEDCFKALAKSAPHLRVLSLDTCQLQGYIDHSLSKLQFLSVINLSNNDLMTPGLFPEFFMYFVNLRVLRLAGINLEGWFPPVIFQSENLRVLDMSHSLNLSGHMPKLSNARSLETLKLHMTNFSHGESNYFSNSISLMELGLDGQIISMNFLSLFVTLESLRKVVLTRLDLQREMELTFLWMEGIKNLTRLEFYECDFSVTNSSIIGNSKNLRSLAIYDSNLKEQTLSAIANIKTLKNLTITSCGILGQLPSAIGNMSSLELLNVFDCLFSGPIPHEVGQLKKLKILILGYTDLSGEIPTYVFSLPALQILRLQDNLLFGPIQEFNVVSSQLYSIDLSLNGLTRQIPQSFFELTNLRYLDISENNLKGSVDLASFWRLKNLTHLSLSNNKLSVMDGEVHNYSSKYLSGLTEVGLASCNLTKLPSFLMYLDHVTSLDLSSNNISGVIPQWIWERWSSSLTSINLSNNMFMGMELTSYVIPFSNRLDHFDVSSNRLRGQIPMPRSSAWYLDYSNNSFSSVLPNFTLYLNETYGLRMSSNNISGYLPHSICDASELTTLNLEFNNFRGLMPACLIEQGYLYVLNLRENHFQGALPSNISSECNFQIIDLHGNNIEGHLLRALYNCSNLELLDLGMNRITDTFPSWLGGHLNLRVLILRSNQFHGSLDYIKDGGYFPMLQILDLASNNLSGNLHPQWFQWFRPMDKYNNTGQYYPNARHYQETVITSYKGVYFTFEGILTTFTSIDLSDNALEGTIPGSIGKLVSLRELNMSHNSFTRQIPPQLGGMTALESLDLSSNMLSGEIPQELTNLTFLSLLNLSNNQLEGMIPRSRQFLTFENSSFVDNAKLCGPPLSKHCGTSDTPREARPKSSSDNVDIVLFLFAGVGFGVGFASSILMKQGWNRGWFRISRILRT
ncbi:hypothetical protein HU200_008049 [Digitaria exilis]|uniref:Leucine-rich repeat-containing N-terminal plant-type domain-containing protein n=1 Tax=Digitaria exilis TaxID=1010633 RepID=A0A835KS00_9POAL|nr:hypothetical protein HU200_008049 [Digitaria exilis]